MTSLLEFSNVYKSFGSRRRRVMALDDVSFSVREGETLGIVGESGGGKSTIGRIAVGLDNPTQGTVAVRGGTVAQARAQHLSQMVFQDPASSLNPVLRVMQCVLEPIDVSSTESREHKAALVQRTLTEVGLDAEIGARLTRALSGGQKQRAAIGRAVSTRPALMVCDEAVTSLDVSVRAQVLNVLREVQALHRLSMLFISHDLATVKYMSDRVMVLYLGKVMEVAPADVVASEPAHPYTNILISSIPRLQQGGRVRARLRMAGDIPSPLHPPPGCRFHTRCPLATDQCRVETPELREVAPGHLVACHYAPVTETQLVLATRKP